MTILIVVLAGLLALVIVKNPFIMTGSVVSEQDEIYSYTKAICNENNFCQDYLIECEGKEVQEMNPIKNAHVQHPKNWKDPREKRELCYRN